MSTRRRPSRRMLLRLTLLAVAAVSTVLLLSGPAMAGQYVDAAASGLANDPVYVSEAADPKPTAAQQDELRQKIRDAGVPMYIAVLPDAALDEAGGNVTRVAQQISQGLRQPGVYAVITNKHFGAGNTSGLLPKGTTSRITDEVLKDDHGKNPQTVLLDFVDRITAAAAQGGDGSSTDSSRSGSGAGAVLGIAVAVLVVVGGGALIFSSRRKRRERERQLQQVKATANEDLLALGEDIRALDIDTQMPDTNPEAVRHYSTAVEAYQKAADALDRTRRVEDMAVVSSALEEGRFAMASTKAVLDGKPLPERRPPCFFDPRHGPSVEDVTWAPPGGAPRSVPACSTDAYKIHNGIEPATREVLVDDRRVPFYQAPAYYGPWYGGFFGGFGGTGFLSGLLLGNLLGGFGGFGGWGAGLGGYGGGDGGDGGDGGGDGGDGGDFGGGDWGGGDFGGGGDWGGGGDFGGGDFGGGGDF
jgi:hypothetical protein